MNKEKYVEDLKEIKDIMNRASRFISLSGLSGVSTGIIALAGAFFAYQMIFKDHGYLVYSAVDLDGDDLKSLLLIAIATLVLSTGSAIFFTNRKTKKQHQRIWNIQTRELLFSLSVPLVTGGLLCLMLMLKGFVGILPSLTLIFYGMALLNGNTRYPK